MESIFFDQHVDICTETIDVSECKDSKKNQQMFIKLLIFIYKRPNNHKFTPIHIKSSNQIDFYHQELERKTKVPSLS